LLIATFSGRRLENLLRASGKSRQCLDNLQTTTLAGDSRFWMQRIYRIALERRESFFAPTTHEDAGWVSMDEVRSRFYAEIPAEDAQQYYVRRPLTGGTIWDEKDRNEREAVIDDAISGAGVMDSLDPIVDVLRAQRVHEDFSARSSWIKEDFERSFYSKRAKLKVELVETMVLIATDISPAI
jgi:hypothetical protein